MKLREKISFLTTFFENEVEEIPSSEEIKQILSLTFDDGTYILNLDNESSRIEVLALFRDLGFDDVMDFLNSVKTFEEMVFTSSLPDMVNARNALIEKREVLTRELPKVEVSFGTCPRCGSESLLMSFIQTSSGDEAMRTSYKCQECPYSSKG